MEKYYFSKNYKDKKSAGNKAKTDIEDILSGKGYKNIGIRSNYKGVVTGYFSTLASLLKACLSMHSNSALVLQYPLKKYYTFLCRVAHLKKCKVITVIHDLGSFRRKRLTVPQEINRLNHSDYIIAHNDSMKAWLEANGIESKLFCLEIFDYLSESKPENNSSHERYRVVYAGALSPRKNFFLQQMGDIALTYDFNLYGSGFETQQQSPDNHINYKGFVPSDKLISTADGDFGLVWDGDSTTSCNGALGEYLQYNNPHKTSLYIRCHLPVIIWSKAALAGFVKKNNIGFCIDSLDQINNLLSSLSREEYDTMRNNVVEISNKLSTGYYISRSLDEVLCEIES